MGHRLWRKRTPTSRSHSSEDTVGRRSPQLLRDNYRDESRKEVSARALSGQLKRQSLVVSPSSLIKAWVMALKVGESSGTAYHRPDGTLGDMLRLIFWGFVFVIALSFFGISIRAIVESPAGQANLAYLLSLGVSAWHWLVLNLSQLKSEVQSL